MSSLGVLPARPSASGHTLAPWWRYVDEARTHEVVAEALPDTLRITESSPSAPDAPYTTIMRIARPWEAQVAIWSLESRLAMLGAYWRKRSVDHGWTRVRPPRGAPAPDARPSEIFAADSGLILHHYHDEGGRLDRVVAAMSGQAGGRHAVIRAELELPALAVGRVALVHPRLPESVMRSVLTREQEALSGHGMPKLVTRADYQRAFGPDGPALVEDAMREMVGRVTKLQWEKPAPSPNAADDPLVVFMATLEDPRLVALHGRFLETGEEAKLMEKGAAAIKRAVALKRVHAQHADQHLLTILEASLLARERLQSGRLTRFDAEVRALTRLAYYL